MRMLCYKVLQWPRPRAAVILGDWSLSPAVVADPDNKAARMTADL